MEWIQKAGVVLSYVSIVSVLIPIINAIRFRAHLYKRFSILLALLIVSLTTDLINEYLVRSWGLGQISLNIYFIVQFVLITWIYFELFSHTKVRLIFLTLVLFLGSCLLISHYVQPISTYQSILRVLGSLLILILAITYFKFLLLRQPYATLMTNGSFWINAGIVFYFGMNLWLFAISNFIFYEMSAEIGIGLWSFHNLNNITKNILFAKAFCYGGDI